ncbi:MAG TPA: glycosyltransferase [Candidatus Acidoferrum sp.]|nr:glycosyltransferase [Candidatus Acidoferrum sp.]
MTSKRLAAYASIAGEPVISQLKKLGESLAGATVVHVNSTRMGGGVAEILTWLTPLMNDLGIYARWEVIDANEEFYQITKSFHNGLQGNRTGLLRSRLAIYEDVLAANAERLRGTLESADFVFIHDPQPAYLLSLCKGRVGKWIWRCHIDVSHPNRAVWNYLKSIVSDYDASIYSMPLFAQPLGHPQFIIAPSIDPLSEKNCDLSDSEIRNTVERFGIDPDVPILTQISRFDRFKDPVGVIKAFQLLGPNLKAQLVLAGGGASDDPEGQVVYEEVREASEKDPRIFILMLPNDAHRTINALQRASTIIIQKSLQEGFGLTVTEALFKGKPVIGGNAGGIRLQVIPHHTGFLVDTPEGAALRMRELLRHPELARQMGETGRQYVCDNYLLTRNLREYLTLMLAFKQNLASRVL